MVYVYYLSDEDKQLSENFMLHEFQSGDGCDEIKVSDILIDYLERLKSALGATELCLTSGYRTSDYSESVGGGRNDGHTKGIAADVYARRDGEIISGAEICCRAQDLGFGGIGYMGNAVHVDVRNEEDYYNNHWWGDENEGCNVDDWYDYFGIDRPAEEDVAADEEEVEAENTEDTEDTEDSDKVTLSYAVKLSNGIVLPFVNDLDDYAGSDGNEIVAIAISASRGSIEYSAHTVHGNWLPTVTGCDFDDFDNGFAGDGVTPIDAIMVVGHGFKAMYQVAPVGGNYYDWQADNETDSKQDGFAGCYGKTIDRVRMYATQND